MSLPILPVLPFGQDDHSYQSAGEEQGIRKLVARFYELMDSEPRAARIRAMHPPDLASSEDRLWRFLCGWLGGPKRYHEVYGPISIPKVHAHFPIESSERDAWMHCMELAIGEQAYSNEFREYLVAQLRVPAERILQAARLFGTGN